MLTELFLILPFKIPCLGEVRLKLSLDLVMWGLAKATPFGDFCVVFNTLLCLSFFICKMGHVNAYPTEFLGRLNGEICAEGRSSAGHRVGSQRPSPCDRTPPSVAAPRTREGQGRAGCTLGWGRGTRGSETSQRSLPLLQWLPGTEGLSTTGFFMLFQKSL